MKQRFVFPLARLARVREIEEQEARSLWSRAEREAEAALEALRAAERAQERARDDLRALLSSGAVNVGRVVLFQGTLSGLAQRITAARAAWRAQRSAADALALAWRAKKQDCESLERLRERAQARHQAELAAHDARGMDDVALQRMAAARAASNRLD